MRGTSRLAWVVLLVWLLFLHAPRLVAQEPVQHPEPTTSARLAPGGAPGQASGPTALQHDVDRVDDDVEQALWYFKLSDVADIDKFLIQADSHRIKNPTGQGAGNPLIIHLYSFTPKKAAENSPLMVFVHGGGHSHFDLTYARIIRELMNRGYIVVVPEYRGSTGYGAEYYNQIDYGGAEVDDVHAVRDWAVANLPHVEPARVGIMGWSHGGYITLLNIFRWPSDYRVAYAGCPVSDLVMRMGYKSQGYRDIFAGFLGKQAVDDPMEYRRRSPYFHAAELATPLLVHSNTADEDVNVMEVQHLIDALKAAGKAFDYRIYENAREAITSTASMPRWPATCPRRSTPSWQSSLSPESPRCT